MTGGVGLGLSVAQAIVQGHGGDIILDHRPGGGLIAAIRLPITDRPEG
jgi:signal transduction histidine kinase